MLTNHDIIVKQILNGRLEMPNIHDLAYECGSANVHFEIQLMFRAMWRAYLLRGTAGKISLPYWAKRIKSPKYMNIALKVLSDGNWITVSTRPNNNWSEAYLNTDKLLCYVTQDDLDHVRTFHKFQGATLELTEVSAQCAELTKTRAGLTDTGLVRNGFMKAGKTEFQFDTVAMLSNHELVVAEVNKGIEESIKKYAHILDDHANYKEVATEIVDSYIHSANSSYNSGDRSSDTRGRNIAGYLSKVGNPVGYKVMRALLLIPSSKRLVCTSNGLRTNYLFIAELNGFKNGTTEDKVNFGRECYYTNQFAHDPVENIWLARVYADIKLALSSMAVGIVAKHWLAYVNGSPWHKVRAHTQLAKLVNVENDLLATTSHKWTVPVEIDMSASILGFISLLLNHKPFMDRCNITNEPLTDAWAHDVITNRDQFKSVMRPLYGSSMPVAEMWRDMEIDYTEAEVTAFNHELKQGDLAVANNFKNFIVNNSNMKSEMTLGNSVEKYKVLCNKHHNVGETTTKFDLYDSHTGTNRRIHNTETKRVDDLDGFKLFGPTSIIHNADSLVMDSSVEAVYDKFGWVIDIHDAMVINPEAGDYARASYANGTTNKYSLKYIHTNRNAMLSAYFTGLNIPGSKLQEFKDTVLSHVIPFVGELTVNPMVLK